MWYIIFVEFKTATDSALKSCTVTTATVDARFKDGESRSW